MRSRFAFAAVALALAAAGAETAHGSTIVYGCGPDICSVSPGGSHKRHVTTDGTNRDPYTGPRLTAGILSFNRDLKNYVADRNARHRRELPYRRDLFGFPRAPQLRADGRRALFYQGSYVGSSPEFTLCEIALKPRARASCPELLPAEQTGWIFGPRRGTFVSVASFNGQERTGDYLCVTRGRVHCEKPDLELRDGRIFEGAIALARGGRWLAAELYEFGDERRSRGHHIVLIDLRRRRVVRDLTRGRFDSHPSWSPDGRRIVFIRLDYSNGAENPLSSICTVSIRGGRVRCPVKRVKGDDTLSPPTWGR